MFVYTDWRVSQASLAQAKPMLVQYSRATLLLRQGSVKCTTLSQPLTVDVP
jgi:hypothetical protein